MDTQIKQEFQTPRQGFRTSKPARPSPGEALSRKLAATGMDVCPKTNETEGFLIRVMHEPMTGPKG